MKKCKVHRRGTKANDVLAALQEQHGLNTDSLYLRAKAGGMVSCKFFDNSNFDVVNFHSMFDLHAARSRHIRRLPQPFW